MDRPPRGGRGNWRGGHGRRGGGGYYDRKPNRGPSRYYMANGDDAPETHEYHRPPGGSRYIPRERPVRQPEEQHQHPPPQQQPQPTPASITPPPEEPGEETVEVTLEESIPAAPTQSVTTETKQRLNNFVACKYEGKGCMGFIPKQDLDSYYEKECVFEPVKDLLSDRRLVTLIKFFKKQISERDKCINNLRAQVSASFKEEKDCYGLEPEQTDLFQDLVFAQKSASEIAATFSHKWKDSEWSVFFHHVSSSDLSYVYDGFFQWVYKNRRYILIKLDKATPPQQLIPQVIPPPKRTPVAPAMSIPQSGPITIPTTQTHARPHAQNPHALTLPQNTTTSSSLFGVQQQKPPHIDASRTQTDHQRSQAQMGIHGPVVMNTLMHHSQQQQMHHQHQPLVHSSQHVPISIPMPMSHQHQHQPHLAAPLTHQTHQPTHWAAQPHN
eukprot:TRINITY_DN51589_c0_g1_i1.p1 TRINITY_DN51589_c0_g1~~TRINITY_DN51589_c0_g1_i1.p1  ORF type:complete len:440 (+),score=42.45 TRINITY_DN51589_c0_g1_i1:22-1341(+)